MTTCLRRVSLLFLFLPLCSFSPFDDCGDYRWDYKILVDPTGWPLLNKKPKSKTISSLNQIARPAKLGKQRTPFETWKVTVTAWVVMLGKEDDRDYHLVLTNNNRTDSLIAEIPDPTCNKVQQFPALVKKYGDARTFVEDSIKAPTTEVKELDQPVKVKVTGFLFFDKMSHGSGHAKNGIEIHPITAIKLAD
ncbi:MAG TPA: hypothetical protein VF487_12460 [Chitinophagaceae bacterium]